MEPETVQADDSTGQLPGKYAVRERLGDYERTATFQTYAEMLNYIEYRGVAADAHQLPRTSST